MVFIYILLCILVHNAIAEEPPMTEIIFKGQPADIKDFPFFAGLGPCGAAIISEEWIVTAAHCVNSIRVRGPQLVFVGGERRNNSYTTRYNKFVIHPKVNERNILSYDIALLKLVSPLNFSNKIRPIKLFTGDVDTIKNGKYIAIGRGLDHTHKISEQLMKLEVKRIPAKECVKFQYTREVMTNYNICIKRAINPTGKDKSMCQGDSGSPLIVNGKLLGLVSHGTGKPCSDLVYFTNVAKYIDWIQEVTGLKY